MEDNNETIHFLMEQNKELKEALNYQINANFSLETENDVLKTELEELKEFTNLEQNSSDKKSKNEPFNSNKQYSDPFHEELERESQLETQKNESLFKFSLTHKDQNSVRDTLNSVDDYPQIDFSALKNTKPKTIEENTG